MTHIKLYLPQLIWMMWLVFMKLSSGRIIVFSLVTSFVIYKLDGDKIRCLGRKEFDI